MTEAAKLPAFVLQAPKDFWWTVRIPVPTDNDYQVAVLDVQFAALPQPELDRMRGVGLQPGEAVPSELASVLRVMRGWRGLQDEHGQAVPYTDAKRDELLAAPAVRTCILATYLAASSGMAARKNA
jgi:hypothetical protein